MQPILCFSERERENLKCDHVLSLLFGGHLSLT
jgi:hypothetical protein